MNTYEHLCYEQRVQYNSALKLSSCCRIQVFLSSKFTVNIELIFLDILFWQKLYFYILHLFTLDSIKEYANTYRIEREFKPQPVLFLDFSKISKEKLLFSEKFYKIENCCTRVSEKLENTLLILNWTEISWTISSNDKVFLFINWIFFHIFL